MSGVMRLGYFGFEVSDLDAWESFGRALVGLQMARPGPDLLIGRLDHHARRLLFRRGPRDDVTATGWEVSDVQALANLGERLALAGFEVTAGTDAEAAERGVDRFMRFADRAGNPLELYCAPAIAQEPWRSDVMKRGFVTGTKGVGHYVAGHPNLAAARALYCDILGLRVSDYIFLPSPDGALVRAMFLHANTRHHSVALVELALPQRIDHFFVQCEAFEDVGRAYDRFLDSGYAIRNTLGQHPNDQAISFYAATPSRFSIEIGWSDFDLIDEGWTTRTYDRTSLWGHRPGSA